MIFSSTWLKEAAHALIRRGAAACSQLAGLHTRTCGVKAIHEVLADKRRSPSCCRAGHRCSRHCRDLRLAGYLILVVHAICAGGQQPPCITGVVEEAYVVQCHVADV